jgi:hypothetical protein
MAIAPTIVHMRLSFSCLRSIDRVFLSLFFSVSLFVLRVWFGISPPAVRLFLLLNLSG